jgi:hypothetical protein
MPEIDQYRPVDLEALKTEFDEWINSSKPAYLNLKRAL